MTIHLISVQECAHMTEAAHCLIVVPCFNERTRIDSRAFVDFADAAPRITFLFVNDGSTDGTSEVLDQIATQRLDRFRILHLEKNRGKAEAVRSGVLHGISLGYSYIGFWDADLATPLAETLEFAAHLDAHPETLIAIGARVRLLGRRIERRAVRHYLGRGFATAVSLLLGIPVYDTQCGAKLFRMVPEVQRLFEQPFRSRWIFDVEILARVLGSYPDADCDEIIHELPLSRWKDVAGSKLRPHHFLVVACELWMIRREHSRSMSAGAKRHVNSRRWYGWHGTNPVALPQSKTTPLQP